MTHALYYVSQDVDDGASLLPTWSVYREQYTSIESVVPIEGTDVLVASGLPTEDEADRIARLRQRQSHSKDRRKVRV